MALIANGFQHPLLGLSNYYLTQDHAQYNADFNGYHLGEDWSAGTGDTDLGLPVRAAANGVVAFAGWYSSGWGNVVIIHHTLPSGQTISTVYGHLNQINVFTGDVTIGQQVGTIGDAGGLYDAHLHFEVYLGALSAPGAGYTTSPDPDPYNSGWVDPSYFLQTHPPTQSRADLEVTSISGATSVAQGQTLNITFTVANTGAASAAQHYVGLNLDGAVSEGDYDAWGTVNALGAGTGQTFNHSINTANLSVGSHTLYIKEDFWQNLVTESDESDNSRSFTFTVTGGNTPPVATISDHDLQANQWSQVASWISYADAENNPATRYEFWDGGTSGSSGYFWTPSNSHHPAGTAISVAAADLSSVWVRGAQVSGAETMYVRAFDGTDWSVWDAFALTTQGNTPPVATISDHSLQANQWSQVASWISYSDANGSPATQYEFWDGGTSGSSGYFWTPSNSHHPAGSAISVAAADLSSVWVRGAQVSGAESMYVRAFDGSDWSAWDAFTLSTNDFLI